MKAPTEMRVFVVEPRHTEDIPELAVRCPTCGIAAGIWCAVAGVTTDGIARSGGTPHIGLIHVNRRGQ